jgi:type IV secretory pathway VirB2 component (pilin)
MNAAVTLNGLTLREQQERASRVRLFILSCMATTMATPAFAQLTETEGVATWVLNIFSPALLLTLLTVLLIGCGLAVYLGKLSGGLFVKILIGSIFVFGARTIAPKIIALF